MTTHKTLVIEYSSRFEDEKVVDAFYTLADKLCDETGYHMIIKYLTDSGTKKIDSLADAGSSWELFNHLESVKFRVRLRSSDSGSYAAKVFGRVVMVDKGIFPNKTIFTFARYQKLAKDYPELPKFDENDPRFEFLEEDD